MYKCAFIFISPRYTKTHTYEHKKHSTTLKKLLSAEENYAQCDTNPQNVDKNDP